ncbi:MAG: metallophosphoesterase [Candidatus Thorarchaeota archaeon]
MKIGIMSDSHDNLQNIKKAIQIFKENKVEVIMHAGDLISPFCIPPFADFKNRFYLCSGNNLGDIPFIKKTIENIGIFFDELGDIELDGKKFALYHGTNEIITEALLHSQKYDYIITGHTHHKETLQEGKTVLINPGETFGDLYGEATIAILNTESNDVTFYDLIK